MIATIAVIAEKKKFSDLAITWKPLSSDRSYRSDNDRCDRYNRWKVVSIWSLNFFSAITAIHRLAQLVERRTAAR